MGCSSSNNCAPQPQLFQECINGNFSDTAATVWSAPPGHYIEGTFEIYNSASSSGDATGSVNGGAVDFTVPSGYTIGGSAENPTVFSITAATGVNGSYCITLYKKVLP